MMIPLAFTYKYGAFCDETKVYPNVLAALPIVYLSMTVFMIYNKRNNFFINWKTHEMVPLHNASDYTN